MLILAACDRKAANPYSNITLGHYAPMRMPAFAVNADAIDRKIASIIRHDNDTMYADYRVKGYYKKGGGYIWITRQGIDGRADTLLTFLKQVATDGFSVERFRVPQIEDDLKKLRGLCLDSITDANTIMGRLEYNLTKAYFRYASGTRFGYVNPYRTFNKIDLIDEDSPNSFRTLYDVDTNVAKTDYFKSILAYAAEDKLGNFLRSIQPDNPYYATLRKRLADPTLSLSQRMKTMINMERCRWRVPDYPYKHDRYIIVNIPSYSLRFVNQDTIADMKVCCGARKTKTPLLYGNIKRIDINPQWVIPKSIIKTDIAHHAGNVGYFSSRRYFIRNRSNGKKVSPTEVSAEMLLSGDYQVIQEGGAHNSLGRIIFRFDNSHSIYLHDTSSPSTFQRTDRSVSHGCIRVEKPYLLASLILENNSDIMSKISYSITADVSPLGKKRNEMTEEQQMVADTLQRKMLIGTVKVQQLTPLFITYYTLYPSAKGDHLTDYPDVYGYDSRIAAILKNYI